ncbi:MAG: c-type cytochrome [Verrucomicrobiae bacterium]|nr:c-type cytochrome [Verrucomicrobiae bacterium]
MKNLLVVAGVALVINSGAADTFPTPHNSESDTNARPISAQEALKQIRLPSGFAATVFAGEPDVQNPIAMAWDQQGRMWVAENFTYAERRVRFDQSLRDRIILLHDTDGDGRSDQRKVFTDQLQTLTSVEVGRGGVWAMCPPHLLFIPDRDGDAVPDGDPIVKLDGFTVADANYHNFANGLRWGPDGWLYGRCGHSCPGRLGVPGTPDAERYPIEGGVWRYHPDREVVEVLTHGTTNPWGHDWTREGELFFINTVNGHLWHGIAGAHFKESFGADPNSLIYDRLDMHADHWHFDKSGSWSASRDGKANEYGGGHAHIGMMIYQGDRWPAEFRDRLLTLNMHGRRANVERLERHGTGYIGRHQNDVFLMGDPWFRGIDIRPGPEGSAYVLDWSDTGECHDHTGVHRTSGRIYRLSYGKPREFASLPVAQALKNADGWHEQILRSRSDLDVSETDLDGSKETPLRLRVLWALHRSGRLSRDCLVGLLADEDEHLRAWAIRLLVDDRPIDTIFGPRANAMPRPVAANEIKRFLKMAKDDSSGLVRLTLASTLQRLPLKQRVGLGASLVARGEDADDHNQPAMVWYGISPLAKTDPLSLVLIAKACQWPSTLKWIARSLATRPAALNLLLADIARFRTPAQLAILQGVTDGLLGIRKAPKPDAWDGIAARFGSSDDANIAGLVRALGVLFGDGRALDEIKQVALSREADLSARQSALQTLIDNKAPDLRDICESLLNERELNAVAVKGLTLFDDPSLGDSLAKSYRRFTSAERPAVIEALVSRSAWARSLLKEIAAGRIERGDLTAYQARQIRSFRDPKLDAELVRVWGEVRESDADKGRLIADLKTKLTPAALAGANLREGRSLYQMVCAACHTLYGEGGKIGPDLTGSGRSDLDYLLENIGDPAAVVSAGYRMTSLTLKDGRTLSGIVVTETPQILTLQQATEQIAVELEEIVKREDSALSMMPDGLFQALQPDQILNLVAYLQHPRQVPLPE